MRAAAITALGSLEDRHLLEMMAEFLRDTHAEVRKAAAEALLWDSERRWTWIRFAVRRLLADPIFYDDGPLAQESQVLCPEAVWDLTAWCAEKGLLSARSALTLAAHYNRALSERPDANLVQTLRQQLANPQTPAVLRLELGKLMQQYRNWTCRSCASCSILPTPHLCGSSPAKRSWPRTPRRTSAAAPSGRCGSWHACPIAKSL